MRDEGGVSRSFTPRPSPLIPRPSSLIPYPSSLIPHPFFFMPRWLLYSLLTIVFWGVWGALGKALGNLSAGQSQAFSTLGILPVMVAVALAPGFRDSSRSLRGQALAF